MKKLSESLQKLEKDGNLTELGKDVMKAIMAFVIVLIFLILAQIGMFVGIFSWLEGVVRISTGLDAMLAKAIAFLLLAFLFGTPLGGFAWSFLPFPQKKKKQKRFIFLSVLAVFFCGAYFSSRNVYFDPETGEALKYYAVDANGEYRFFSSEGYDPVTGEELRPVDGRIIADLYSGRSVLVQQREAASETEAYYLNAPNESPLSRYESHYLVRFKNEQDKGIFLCYTEGHSAASGTTVVLIPTHSSLSLRLSEGSHQLAFVDSELKQHGHRKGGPVLSDVGFDESLRLNIEGQEKILSQGFILQVLAKKKQVVTLKDGGLVTHSQEKSGEEKDLFLGLLLTCLGIFSAISIFTFKVNADLIPILFFGGITLVIYGLTLVF